ncbi:MAG: hypothetical protein U0414_02100 [Polyangiaceae bacterium]
MLVSSGFASSALAGDLQVAADPPPVTPAPAVASPRPPQIFTTTAAPPPPVPETTYSFYGWQNMLVGELGLGAAIAGSFVGDGEAGALGGLVYVFGGPMVHALHEAPLGKIFGSLAGNVVIPLIGAGIGAGAADDGGDDPGQGAAIGALVGCVIAPIWDGLVLGHQTKRGSDVIGRASAPPPMVGLATTRRSATVTLAGQF